MSVIATFTDTVGGQVDAPLPSPESHTSIPEIREDADVAQPSTLDAADPKAIICTESAHEEVAVSKIQLAEAAAATKIQAVGRGTSARREAAAAGGRRAAAAAVANAAVSAQEELASKEAAAATKIQAVGRGTSARREAAAAGERRSKAAVHVKEGLAVAQVPLLQGGSTAAVDGGAAESLTTKPNVGEEAGGGSPAILVGEENPRQLVAQTTTALTDNHVDIGTLRDAVRAGDVQLVELLLSAKLAALGRCGCFLC